MRYFLNANNILNFIDNKIEKLKPHLDNQYRIHI